MRKLPPQFPCADDVPQDLRERVNLLHAKQQQVLDLETQVEVLKNECENLRFELSRYLIRGDVVNGLGPASSDRDNNKIDSGEFAYEIDGIKDKDGSERPQAAFYARKGPPIHQCPDEILEFIFSLYLVHHHMSIRILLLVSKRWHRLVLDCPRLWARVQVLNIRPFIDWNKGESLGDRYITACMERSNGLPIDVELDLSGLDQTANEFLWRLAGSWNNPFGRDFFEKAIDRINEKDACTLDDYVCRAIGHLACDCYCPYGIYEGEDTWESHSREDCSCYLHRWRTLSITLPNYKRVAHHIWERLHPATSKLVSVEVKGYVGNWLRPAKRFEGRLPTFIEARSLKLPLGLSILDFKVSPSLIQHLDIQFTRDMVVLQELSTLEHLESLKLHGVDDFGPPPLNFTISLPCLKTFDLSGSYRVLSYLAFDLPSLQLLSLSGRHTHRVLKGILPQHLKWRVPHHGECIMGKIPLLSLLSTYSTAQSFTIPARFQVKVMAALFHNKEVLPKHLQWLVEDENGCVANLDISKVELASGDTDTNPQPPSSAVAQE